MLCNECAQRFIKIPPELRRQTRTSTTHTEHKRSTCSHKPNYTKALLCQENCFTRWAEIEQAAREYWLTVLVGHLEEAALPIVAVAKATSSPADIMRRAFDTRRMKTLESSTSLEQGSRLDDNVHGGPTREALLSEAGFEKVFRTQNWVRRSKLFCDDFVSGWGKRGAYRLLLEPT